MNETRSSPRGVPPYNVVLADDGKHSLTFVVRVLCRALGHSPDRAYQLMLQAHQNGRAAVWTGPKEVAELKMLHIGDFYEEPHGPLDCRIEPAA